MKIAVIVPILQVLSSQDLIDKYNIQIAPVSINLDEMGRTLQKVMK